MNNDTDVQRFADADDSSGLMFCYYKIVVVIYLHTLRI